MAAARKLLVTVNFLSIYCVQGPLRTRQMSSPEVSVTMK